MTPQQRKKIQVAELRKETKQAQETAPEENPW